MYAVRIRGEQPRVFENSAEMEKFVRNISRLLAYTKNRDWIHLEVFGRLTEEDLDHMPEDYYQQCINDACVEHH
jgi:hypothetical protein